MCPLDVADAGFSLDVVYCAGSGVAMVALNYGPSDAPLAARFNETATRSLVTGLALLSPFDSLRRRQHSRFAGHRFDVDVNSDRTLICRRMDNASLTRIILCLAPSDPA